MKKLFIFLLFLPVLTFAGGTSGDYVKVITDSWMSFFHLIDGFKWLLAIAPMLLAGWAIGQAKRRIIKMGESGMGGPGQQGGEGYAIDGVKIYTSYIVGSVISLYIIYGTFGVVYADATSYSQVWDELVMKFWKHLFHV